jgi:D-alanyl-D-alanine carboxypeptidase
MSSISMRSSVRSSVRSPHGGARRRTFATPVIATLGLAAALLVSACGGTDDTTAEIARDLVARRDLPAAMSVCATTERINFGVAGKRRSDAAPLAQPRDLFPVGSLTKSMTATLAAMLVDEGRLRWDSRVLEVLPEAATGARAEYAAVTLLDLLAHRGGIVTPGSLAALPPLSGDLRAQRAQLAAWALAQPPASRPIEQVEYSNAGYVLAAAVIERAANEGWESLIQRRLFAPLAIRARIGMPGSGGADATWGHARAENGRWVALPPDDLAAELPALLNPAGFVLIDAEGLGRYLQLHLRALAGRPGQLITPAAARRMHTVVAGNFALGWYTVNSATGATRTAHNGSDDLGYLAEMRLDQRAGKACAVVATGLAPSTEDLVTAAVERGLSAK